MTCATLCGDFWSDHPSDNDALTSIMQVDFLIIILFQYSWTGMGTSLLSSGHPTNIIAFKLWSSSCSVASVVVLNFHLNMWRSPTGLRFQPLRQTLGTLHLLFICWQDKLLMGDLLTCEPGLYITSKLNCCRGNNILCYLPRAISMDTLKMDWNGLWSGSTVFLSRRERYLVKAVVGEHDYCA